jgi:hypothetical protein
MPRYRAAFSLFSRRGWIMDSTADTIAAPAFYKASRCGSAIRGGNPKPIPGGICDSDYDSRPEICKEKIKSSRSDPLDKINPRVIIFVMQNSTKPRGPGRPRKSDGLQSLTVRVTQEQAKNLEKLRPNASRVVRKALENAGLGKSE